MDSSAIPTISPILQFAIMIWSILWKGIALWNAAKHSQKNWFVVILVINTLGILELVYLFKFAKKRFTLKELKFWGKKTDSSK